jgi:hypothetical protein
LQTFTVRAGPHSAGQVQINGTSGRNLGGSLNCYIIITEIAQ